MQLHLTREQLNTRGGMLDEVLERVFDAAILLDEGGHFIYLSDGSIALRKLKREEVLGRHFRDVQDWPVFSDVLHSGRAQTGLVVTLDGRKCITNVHPILEGDQVIGVLGTILFHNIRALKEVIAGVKRDIDKDAGELFDVLARVETSYTFDDYVGQSLVTRKLLEECRKISLVPNRSVLLIGETGTGKEILANAIHSGRGGSAWHPFVKINCSAIPNELLESELFGHEKGAFTGAVNLKKGKFELANGGSILLDEIGDMDLRMQSKLLRVLEEREFERVGGTKMLPFNARVIASTNVNLRERSAEGAFRADLYYRLSALEIRIPPLRDRLEDIPLLVQHFAKRDQLGIELLPEALEALMQYTWPGNIRELRNVVNRLDIMSTSKVISRPEVQAALSHASLTAHPGGAPASLPGRHKLSSADWEKHALEETLRSCGYNLTKTARVLGICRATVYNRMRKYGIDIRQV